MAHIATENSGTGYTFDDIQLMANELLKHSELRPKIGIICGTGLSGIADALKDKTIVPYTDIPGFPVSTVKGHSGKFVIGTLGEKPVLLMMGRLHFYEGYPMWKVAMPVRVMKAVGVETLLVTNAAGGLNSEFNVGDLMVITDHIDLPGMTGECVLTGHNDERFGPRFLPTNGAYDKELRAKFKAIMVAMGHGAIVREGIYLMVGGPTFCSRAEVRIFKMYGADAVGMSTIPEVIVARHSSMRVFGLSLITDKEELTENADEHQLSHDEVLAAANQRASLLQDVFLKFVQDL